jgi:homocysteine S-methyltransferase
MASQLFPILLLDGGLGTTLEAPPYNVKLAASTPLWSAHLLIDAPDTILAVQTDFVKAGSNVLLTATYQASYEGFAATKRERNQSTVTSCSEFNPQKQGYDRAEASEYMRKAVAISREAL